MDSLRLRVSRIPSHCTVEYVDETKGLILKFYKSSLINTINSHDFYFTSQARQTAAEKSSDEQLCFLQSKLRQRIKKWRPQTSDRIPSRSSIPTSIRDIWRGLTRPRILTGATI